MSQKQTCEPELLQVKTGWMALAEGWAVMAPTKEEVLELYHRMVELRQEIDARPYFYERAEAGLYTNHRQTAA